MAAAAAAAVVWRFAATAAQGGKNVSPATGWRADAAAAMASWGDLVHSPRASPPPLCAAPVPGTSGNATACAFPEWLPLWRRVPPALALAAALMATFACILAAAALSVVR